MPLTKVSFSVIQVANNVTSTTVGNTTSIPSFTFDQNGVITAASNTAISGAGITANTIANSAFQTGSVEKYLRGANLDFGMRNRIINGAMVIDQRNAGATQAITSAGTPTYCLDRWAVSLGATASGTLTTQRVAGDATNQYAVRIARTAGTYADNIRFYQVIETSNCYDLQGKNITISWRARQGSSYAGGAQTLTVITGSGTDQGIASMVSETWTSSAFNFPTVTGTLSTSFSTFTATFAVPAGTTEIGVRISTGNFSGTGSANDYLDITGVQLEVGTQATSFEYRQTGTELVLCQRYYEKSYNQDVAVPTATYVANNFKDTWAAATSRPLWDINFAVLKRANPSMVFYSPNGTTAGKCGGPSNADYNCTTNGSYHHNFQCYQSSGNSSSTPGADYYLHWSASAEL